MKIRFTTAFGLALVLATAAVAADPATLERGRILAEQLCGKCHATGQTGASPHKITPPFRELSERFPVEMLVESLKTGEISGHDEMPMFILEPADMQALIAHIDSFADQKSRYLPATPK
jgi:cytochrome c